MIVRIAFVGGILCSQLFPSLCHLNCQEPDKETGDIIIVLDEREHERFGRKGSDLIYKMVCYYALQQDTMDALLHNAQLILHTNIPLYCVYLTAS